VESIWSRLQPASRKLLAAWRQLPRPEIVPTRADFDPCEIAAILPVISVVERTAADKWRVRLAGTEIERRWGRDLVGLTFAEMLSPQAAEVAHCEFGAICRQPCGSWSLRRLDLRSGRRVQTETLRLPLRARDGRVRLIVSCNGELSPDMICNTDQPSQIVTVLEQEFFDIGAGVPAFSCVMAAA
jgi:hypothetical protein